MTAEFFHSGLLQGLILALVAFGIMIPFRFLNFSDLTAEGAYPLGGALCATLLGMGLPPSLACLGGMVGGGLMAIGTAHVALRLKIHSLLAGIILSTMVYSLNLRILGKPNISLFHVPGLALDIPFLVLLLGGVVGTFSLFLATTVGLRFRAVGLNPLLTERLRISLTLYTSLGLGMAGALFGLGGSLMVFLQQFMDVGMGVGIVIHGLASLMIGEALTGRHTLLRQLSAPVIGALLYQQIQGIALGCGLAPSDLKFFTGGLVLLVLFFQRIKSAEGEAPGQV